MRHMHMHMSARGFTLLEVMVALAVLAVSLIFIARSQQNSMRAAMRSRLMSEAVGLARYKMIEIEDELYEKGFNDFKEEEEGDFKEEGHERFTYKVKIDKVELPESVSGDSLSNLVESATEGSGAGQGTGSANQMATLGAKMIGQYFGILRQTLEQSIRRVELKVLWKEGTREREVAIATYFTDTRMMDAVMGGGAIIPGAGTGGGAGTGIGGGINSGGTNRGGINSGGLTNPLQPATPRRPGGF